MAEGTSNIGEWIQTHPQILIAGAVGVGLLFFLSSNRSQTAPALSASPIAQNTPDPAYLTVDQFNGALDDYDKALREYIAGLVDNGTNPPPDPLPVPYTGGEGEPGGGNNGSGEPGGGGDPIIGDPWNPKPGDPGGGEKDPTGTGGGRLLPAMRVCPPGYVWSADAGQCVRAL